jgi:hypothetical protein
MRRLVTLAAAALTLGVLGATAPAFADAYDQGNYGQGNYGQGARGQNQQYQQEQYDEDPSYQDEGTYRGRNVIRKFDFNRHEGKFDKWERGWGDQGFSDFRHQRPMTYWRLARRLESQGYYGVRGLRKSHFGFGWRAFAFNYRGQPVMLRVNPFTGRVLNVRYV